MVSEYIKKIRSSDEHTKRRWVIVSSGVVMIIIVVVWIIYISATLPRTSMNQDDRAFEKQEIVTETTKNISVIGSIVKGIKITTNNIFASIFSVGNTFKNGLTHTLQYATKKKEVIIQKEEIKEIPFQPNDIEPLEPTLLP